MTIVTWMLLGLLLVGVLSLAWAFFDLLRHHGQLLLRVEALEARVSTDKGPGRAEHVPPGLLPATVFPPFRLPSLDDGEVSLEQFRGRRVLLVHWSPDCGYCRQIAPDLAGLQEMLRRWKTELVLVSYGSREANTALGEEHGLDCRVLLQPDGETVEGFAHMGTPVAYLLDEKGRIAKPVAVGAHEVPELAEHAAGRQKRLRTERPVSESRIEREGLKAGTPAPRFELPDLAGGAVSLAEQRGRRVLLVFSDPDCGPCEELLPELARLDRDHRSDGLSVVMISRGGREENRRKAEAFGLEFPVALQSGWKLSKKYGIFATPVAFLVDEEGVIERDVARGRSEILTLADAAVSAERGVVRIG
jgi:peroxiredoxin